MDDYQEFPKWVYHADFDEILIETRQQQNELGPGWCETPVERTPKPRRGRPPKATSETEDE